MSDLKAKEYKQFEDIKTVREDGSEFWTVSVQIWHHNENKPS